MLYRHWVFLIGFLYRSLLTVFKGGENGAAVSIEKTLNEKLLWFPCRHHIYELVLKSVAEVVWPVSCGLTPAVFSRFKWEWSTIYQSPFKTGMDNQNVKQILCEKKQDILEFVLCQMMVKLINKISLFFLYDKYHQRINKKILIILGILT